MSAEEKPNTYGVSVYCSNCGERYQARLAYGVLVSSEPCKTCGCKNLNKAARKGSEGFM